MLEFILNSYKQSSADNLLCFADSAFLSLYLDGQTGCIGFAAEIEAVLTLTQREPHSSGSGRMTEHGPARPGPAQRAGVFFSSRSCALMGSGFL